MGGTIHTAKTKTQTQGGGQQGGEEGINERGVMENWTGVHGVCVIKNHCQGGGGKTLGNTQVCKGLMLTHGVELVPSQILGVAGKKSLRCTERPFSLTGQPCDYLVTLIQSFPSPWVSQSQVASIEKFRAFNLKERSPFPKTR